MGDGSHSAVPLEGVDSLWSKSAIYGSALLRGAMPTKCTFSTLSSPRLDWFGDTVEDCAQQFSAVRSRPRPSNTSFPGVMHHLPPLRHRASPSLLAAVDVHPVSSQNLLGLMLNHHLGRRIEPLVRSQPPQRP